MTEWSSSESLFIPATDTVSLPSLSPQDHPTVALLGL